MKTVHSEQELREEFFKSLAANDPAVRETVRRQAADEVTRRAKEFQRKHNTTFVEALHAILDDDQELKHAYATTYGEVHTSAQRGAGDQLAELTKVEMAKSGKTYLEAQRVVEVGNPRLVQDYLAERRSVKSRSND